MLLERIYGHFRDKILAIECAMDELTHHIANAVEIMVTALANGKKILVCGNGGSAADAQHFAAELIGRFDRERPGLACLALTTDSSILTAVGNDYGFDQIFVKQIKALGQAGDVLLVLSTSGNSANILAAVCEGQERELAIIALTGNGGGALAKLLQASHELLLCVPSGNTARIQEIHLFILHCLCDGIDYLLLGETMDENHEDIL